MALGSAGAGGRSLGLLAALALAALAGRAAAVEPDLGTVALSVGVAQGVLTGRAGPTVVFASRVHTPEGPSYGIVADLEGLVYLAPWVAAGLDLMALRSGGVGGRAVLLDAGPVAELDLRLARRLTLFAKGWLRLQSVEGTELPWLRGETWGGAAGAKVHLGDRATLDLALSCSRSKVLSSEPGSEPIPTTLVQAVVGFSVYLGVRGPDGGRGAAKGRP